MKHVSPSTPAPNSTSNGEAFLKLSLYPTLSLANNYGSGWYTSLSAKSHTPTAFTKLRPLPLSQTPYHMISSNPHSLLNLSPFSPTKASTSDTYLQLSVSVATLSYCASLALLTNCPNPALTPSAYPRTPFTHSGLTHSPTVGSPHLPPSTLRTARVCTSNQPATSTHTTLHPC